MPSVIPHPSRSAAELSLPVTTASGGECCGASAALPGSTGHGSGNGCGCASSPPAGGPSTGKIYWRSLDELAQTPEFLEFVNREFPTSATELLSSHDRRRFLKLMGASLALAGFGMAGCRRWPEEKIAPYASRPAAHTPGTTHQYATCMEIGGVAAGLLATSYDFRPIKIEGNPLHPTNGNAAQLPANLSANDRARMLHGATDAYMQASILDLYDPDRSRAVMRGEQSATWDAFAAWAADHFAALRSGNRGAELAILSEASNSPSVLAMRRRVQEQLKGAQWFEYEPINNDSELAGSQAAFGAAYQTHYAFDKARVVVALDSDFLHCGPAALRWTRDFASARRPQDRQSMNRLYAFESQVTITGANADHRVALRTADVALIAARLAQQLLPQAAAAAGELASQPVPTAAGDQHFQQVMSHLIADLQRERGRSIIIAGPRQPAEVHLLVHLLNQALGNVGQTISYSPLSSATPHLESIRKLAAEIDAGRVRTLVILGGNPAYDAPADLDFAALLQRVPATVHLSHYVDETSRLCTWHVNRAHYLEAWGDGRGHDGTVSLAQPLILPLFGGRSAIELLALISGDPVTDGYEIVRRTFRELVAAGDFETNWRKSLHDGVVPNSAYAIQTPRGFDGSALQQHMQALQGRWTPAKPQEFEITFAPDYSLLDGRYANNGWLMEMPDPVTKLTWDNAVHMGPAAAKALGLKTRDMVRITLGDREVAAAVQVIPGQYSGSVTLTLGYGREFAGRISRDAGFNFYKLRGSDSMGFAGGRVTATGDAYALAITQDHYPIDSVPAKGTQERLPTLLREATLEEYQHHPDFAKHRAHVVHRLSLWEEDFSFHSNTGRDGAQYAWAMSIDLNACTGCHACVIACQAENNVPIVGKEAVTRGREMHWLRVDRYFKGSNPDAPEFIFSPLPCMHCENAPCEQVCPVAATVHDDQGLNVMVYNRCVGTRYCSNNCPYKVRRFNYFDYHRREPHREQPGLLLHVEPEYYLKAQAKADPLRQMQFNPEVTVRMRGIMEKCTYCVQRITKARIEAKNEWVRTRNLQPDAPLDTRVPIQDGAIVTACAQACPAEAIVFGDLNDPNSRIAQLHKHERTYEMLEELNTKPRTRYMAKLRNPAFVSDGAQEHAHG